MNELITNWYVKLRLLAEDQRGVTAIEYAIVAVAISALVLVAFDPNNGLGAAISEAIATVTQNITDANDATPTPP